MHLRKYSLLQLKTPAVKLLISFTLICILSTSIHLLSTWIHILTPSAHNHIAAPQSESGSRLFVKQPINANLWNSWMNMYRMWDEKKLQRSCRLTILMAEIFHCWKEEMQISSPCMEFGLLLGQEGQKLLCHQRHRDWTQPPAWIEMKQLIRSINYWNNHKLII